MFVIDFRKMARPKRCSLVTPCLRRLLAQRENVRGLLSRQVPPFPLVREPRLAAVREELDGMFSAPSGTSLLVTGEECSWVSMTSSPTSTGSIKAPSRLSLPRGSPRVRSAASPKQLMISMTSVRSSATPTRPSSGNLKRPGSEAMQVSHEIFRAMQAQAENLQTQFAPIILPTSDGLRKSARTPCGSCSR